jgi:DNA gyrase subunit A
MIINRSGLTIRTAVEQIRVAGRATQGVKIINLREGDSIASDLAVPKSEEETELAQDVETVQSVETVEGVEATATVETVESETNN